MSGSASKYDHYSCSADVGRVSTGEPAFEQPTIVCPEMTVAWVPRDTPSMTETQCKLRIRLKNKCTIHCKAISHLKK